MNIEQEIQNRIDSLNIDDSKKDKAIVMFTGNLYRRVGLRIAETLPEDDLNQFNELVDSNPQEAFNFLNSKLPNFDNLVTEELNSLTDEFRILAI